MRLTEGKLLQGAPVRLGVEDELENDLEGDPTTVDGEELPADGSKRKGVHVVREEAGQLAKDLLHSDTATAHRVREQLDQVR